jgi:hypothetical protein
MLVLKVLDRGPMRALFRRDAVADEIREELEFHVAMRAEEYARDGRDPAAWATAPAFPASSGRLDNSSRRASKTRASFATSALSRCQAGLTAGVPRREPGPAGSRAPPRA